MAITRDSLRSAISSFVDVLERCLAETTFIEDRRLYADDRSTARQWLTRLDSGETPATVASEVVAPHTAKQFTDYWRNGTWGDQQSAALAALQEGIRMQR